MTLNFVEGIHFFCRSTNANGHDVTNHLHHSKITYDTIQHYFGTLTAAQAAAALTAVTSSTDLRTVAPVVLLSAMFTCNRLNYFAETGSAEAAKSSADWTKIMNLLSYPDRRVEDAPL